MVGDVLDVLKQLAGEGVTMVVVTHEMGLLEIVANHVIFMDGGQDREENNPMISLVVHKKNEPSKVPDSYLSDAHL